MCVVIVILSNFTRCIAYYYLLHAHSIYLRSPEPVTVKKSLDYEMHPNSLENTVQPNLLNNGVPPSSLNNEMMPNSLNSVVKPNSSNSAMKPNSLKNGMKHSASRGKSQGRLTRK